MKKVKILLIILFLVADIVYSHAITRSVGIIFTADSIKSDFSFSKIELNRIDPTKISNSDSLVLGRFINNESPVINDWQFYLPYKDTVEIDLFDKDGNFIVNLLTDYLIPGYYQLIVLPNKTPSNKYIIRFSTSRNKIYTKFILLH